MISRMLDELVPLLRLQNDVNRLFNDFFDDAPGAGTRPTARRYPAINLWEDGDAAHVESELPGLTHEDIDVSISGNEVTIAGERKVAEQPDAAWHRRERPQGRFSRTLTLPWEVDADHVEATFRDGVLHLRLPKSETAKPKKVKVLGA